jgi:hypothetical protein
MHFNLIDLTPVLIEKCTAWVHEEERKGGFSGYAPCRKTMDPVFASCGSRARVAVVYSAGVQY